MQMEPAMNHQCQDKTVLRDGSRVTVIGGGPAGAFFAIYILQAARRTDRNIAVTIIEKKSAHQPAQASGQIKGCNLCAGVISPRLHTKMGQIGIHILQELICKEFTHLWIHGRFKNFPLKIPPGQKMCSVFRGTRPEDRNDRSGGFDSFILNQAVKEGARLITREVNKIQYTPSEKPRLTVSDSSGASGNSDSPGNRSPIAIRRLRAGGAVVGKGYSIRPTGVRRDPGGLQPSPAEPRCISGVCHKNEVQRDGSVATGKCSSKDRMRNG